MSSRRSSPDQIFAGPLLRRLGVLFLERFERHRQPGGSRKRNRGSAAEAPAGVLSRRHVHAPGRAFRISISAPSGSRRRPNLPVMPGDPSRHAFDAAWRAVVPDDGVRSASPSTIPIQASREPISPRWCNCATPCRAVVLAGCGEPDLGELIKPIQLTAKTR